MKKTILTILVCGVMILGLTGCGISKIYLADEEIKYEGIKIIFNSEYRITKGCSSDFSNNCYEVQIPFEIINTSNKTYDVHENGPFFDVYTPSGILESAYNNGYLETWGQVKLKKDASIKDIMKFNVKESGEYTLETRDGKIKISYNIVIPN